jgi:Uma2 family endonuclease
MNAVATETRYTPEDLLRMADSDRYELVDGWLVEEITSPWACYVAGQVLGCLHDYRHTKPLGWVFPGGVTYHCFPSAPNNVRKADVSFIKMERLSVEQFNAEGHLRVAPDLAVEVLSPNDRACDVNKKVQEYLTAGVHLVWVVDPQTRIVQVYRAQGTGTILREQDELDGENVLPGFRCPVRELFTLPAGVPPLPRGNGQVNS